MKTYLLTQIVLICWLYLPIEIKKGFVELLYKDYLIVLASIVVAILSTIDFFK